MAEKCRYCEARAVVPVLDKNIELKPTDGGNKYRRRCTSCDRWNPMCSAEHYENDPNPHVLPLDAAPDAIVPLRDYDYEPEMQELVDSVEQRQQRAVATDGGDPVDGDPDPEPVDEPEPEPEPEPENEFECPGCGAQQHGFPDECSECGAPYNW